MAELKEPLYIGIDPGASGGIAWLGAKVGAITIPKTELDILNRIINVLWNDERFEIFAMIEEIPTAIFGTDKTSMSKLYGSYMQLRMALVAVGVAFETVKAKDWQAGLGIPKRGKGEKQSKWKNRLKAKAQQLFTKLHPTLSTCDALLIAEYCKRKRGGTL